VSHGEGGRGAAGAAWLLAAALLAAAAFGAATTLAALLEGRWSGPVADFWRFVALLEALERGEPVLAELWRPHGGHRLVFPRLLYLAEYRLAGGGNRLLLACALAFQALLAATLLAAAWRARRRLGDAALAGFAGASAALLFSATGIENLGRGWNVHWPLAQLAVALALAALATLPGALARGRRAAAALRFGACCAAALAASLSMVNGLLAWPACAVAALALRLPARWLVALTGLGAGCALAYAVGYDLREGAGSEALSQPLAIPRWFLACLGAPLARGETAALAWGAGVLLAACVLVYDALVRRDAGSLAALLLGLLVFSLGSLFWVAAGRAALSPGSWWGGRYRSLTDLAWLCVFGLALLRAARSGQAAAGLAALFAPAAFVAAALLPAQLPAAAAFVADAETIRRAHLAVVAGAFHRDSYRATLPLTRCGPEPDCVHTHAPFLRRHALGMFADPGADLLGLRVGEDVALVDTARCRGEIGGAERLAGPPPAQLSVGARIEGRARDVRRGGPPRAILVADAQGRLIGIGAALGRDGGSEDGAPFTAFSPTPQGGGSLSLFALVGEREVCPLGGPVTLWPGRL
jgi:hypothetical protein